MIKRGVCHFWVTTYKRCIQFISGLQLQIQSQRKFLYAERLFAYKFGGIRGTYFGRDSVCSFLVSSTSTPSIDLGRTNGLDHKRAGDDYWYTTYSAQVWDNL